MSALFPLTNSLSSLLVLLRSPKSNSRYYLPLCTSRNRGTEEGPIIRNSGCIGEFATKETATLDLVRPWREVIVLHVSSTLFNQVGHLCERERGICHGTGSESMQQTLGTAVGTLFSDNGSDAGILGG